MEVDVDQREDRPRLISKLVHKEKIENELGRAWKMTIKKADSCQGEDV